jgi:hypothetical protein
MGLLFSCGACFVVVACALCACSDRQLVVSITASTLVAMAFVMMMEHAG